VTPFSLNQLLILYTWFLLAAFIFLFLLIARFYQNFSGENTHFRLFIVPIILFGAAAVRYTSIKQVTRDPLADLLSAAAGFTLLVLSISLYRWMTGGRERS
jgi:hypothetical protein